MKLSPRLRLLPRALGAACLTWLVAAAAVQADDAPVPGEVLVVLGKTEGQHIDPALEQLPALGQAPFKDFTHKRLLSRHPVKLTRGTPAEVDLPKDRKLLLQLAGRGEDGMYRIQVSLKRPGKQDDLPLATFAAAPGDAFFIAGQRYQGGTLIIGIRVVDPAASPTKKKSNKASAKERE